MPLVDALSNEILPWLDQPWAVFGHSMGGLIGFELVRYLAVRHGILPVHLFVSACVSPSWMAQRARLHQLPDADFINELQRRYNALPDAILADEELLGLFIPILRADCELLDTYTYDPALSLACRITAYGGREDHEMQEKELEAWREETQAEFNLQLFSGGHFYLQENLAPVLEAVARSLTNHPSGGTVV
jgi:medium-chain acyl-[acyl-carrier-protein] hydrolase